MQSIDHELKIEKVAEAPNGAMRLLLSDGSEWVVGIKSWNRLNLSLEKILDVNVLRALEKESQYHLLRTKALELLGIREHSRQELKRKLIGRFHNHEPEIERCLEELQSEDYLSDQRSPNYSSNLASTTSAWGLLKSWQTFNKEESTAIRLIRSWINWQTRNSG